MSSPRASALVIWLALSLLPSATLLAAPVLVHNWSFTGPGGRYGITETRYTLADNFKVTDIWLGPFHPRRVCASAPIVAACLFAGPVASVGLALALFQSLAMQGDKRNHS
jgi:hypothetical protein